MKILFTTLWSLTIVTTNTSNFYQIVNQEVSEQAIKKDLAKATIITTGYQADDNNFRNYNNIRKILVNLNLDISYYQIVEKTLIYWNQIPESYHPYYEFQDKLTIAKDLSFNIDTIFQGNWSMLDSIKKLFKKININLQNKILTFYRQLISLYNERVVKYLINAIDYSLEDDNSLGLYSYYNNPFQSCISLNLIKAFNFPNHIINFRNHIPTALSEIYTLIHEYGHALNYYFRINKDSRNFFNTNNNNVCKNLTNSDHSITISNIENIVRSWFINKYPEYFNTPKALDFFILLSVPSMYALNYQYKPDNVNDLRRIFQEMVAEAFSYWLLNPHKSISLRWIIWDEFFRTTIRNEIM